MLKFEMEMVNKMADELVDKYDGDLDFAANMAMLFVESAYDNAEFIAKICGYSSPEFDEAEHSIFIAKEVDKEIWRRQNLEFARTHKLAAIGM